MLLRGNLYIRCIYARPVDILLIGLILTALSIAYPPDTKAADPVTAIGYGPLNYQLPNPGSYSLPPLGRAPNGSILDANGNPTLLHEIFGDDVILLSFMYSSCSDINGCPLSSYVLHKIKSAMQDDPGLAAGLKLVSLSFDPDTDTPEVMRLYGENFRFAGEAGQWDFITTNSLSELQPILNAYDQDVQRQVTNNTASGVEISHLLKVFLIDRRKQIRNIYSVSFLHPDLLINDVRTLLMESAKQQTETILVSATPTLSRPGDEKSGYEELDYETDSLALENRRGREMDLLQLVKSAPAGLPQVPQPEHNPITRSKVSLGRKLFYDRRLSINDTFSCAMCHVPEQGFTSNEIATAVGVEGRSVRRNTPTLYNIAYATRLFHDGREENLEQQVWGPLLAKNEMANPSVGYVLQKIRSLPDYDHLFEQAFDGRGAGMETVGMALASYQRTLVSANSPFDRWHYSNEEGALSESAQKGFLFFTGKAGCVTCHSIGDDHALFTDNAMHNTGIG